MKAADIQVKSIHQIGITVRDVEKVARGYWNVLGIGPWKIFTIQNNGERTYHGKPTSFEIKQALCQVGPIDLALSQTLTAPTLSSDFMAEHGEGAYRLQYLVDSLDELDRHVEIMTQRGFSSLMGGHFGSNGAFNYLDTAKALKTVWGVAKLPEELVGSAVRYPADEAEVSPHARIKVKALTQVSLSVKNLEETMESYSNLLGVGPWQVFECTPPILHGHTYHGGPGNFTMMAGLAQLGPVELELIQPLSGDSVYSDFIREHGEGINHVQFTVDDVDGIIKIMTEEGFPLLQSGHAIGDDYFSYYDTRGTLKIIWEAWEPPKKPL